MIINNKKTAETYNKKLTFGIKDLPKSLICRILVNLDNKTLFKISKLKESDSGFNLRKECDLVFIYKRFLFIERKRNDDNMSRGLLMFNSPFCDVNKWKDGAVSLTDCDAEEEGSTLRDDFDEEAESKVEKCVNKLEATNLAHANSTNNNIFQTVHSKEEPIVNIEINGEVLTANAAVSKDIKRQQTSVLMKELEDSSTIHSPGDKEDNSFLSENSYTSSTPTKQQVVPVVTQEMIEQFDTAVKELEDEQLPQDFIKPLPLRRKTSQNNILNSSISDKIKFFEAQIRIHNDCAESKSKV